MKIFSNFNTRAPLEAYQTALAQYGADKVIFFRRYRIYLIFFVVLPSIALGVLILVAAVGRWSFAAEFFPNFFSNIVVVVLITLMALMVIVRIVLNYINYLLDYTIVTPHIITSYNQTGLFKREIRTIDTDKIKTIMVNEASLIQSIFNYGSLVFLSEGDEENHGDIRLNYLRNPSLLKDDVVRVVNLAKDL